jgi:glyoxylate reductase
MKNQKVVLITRKIPLIAQQILEENGIIVKIGSKSRVLSKEEIINKTKYVDAVITMLSDKIDREIIDKMPKVKIISNFAVGYNNIDFSYAKEKGIVVTNTPDILTNATADIALGLILAASRNFHLGNKMVREQKFTGWAPEMLLGVELFGKTLGIIGAGRIGQAVANRAKSFGCKIIYFSQSKKSEFEKTTDAKKFSLENLLKESDIISLHLPLSENTYHLLNKENMHLMKKNVIIVNTARGEIIDESELIKMLKNKSVFAAGLDVYENEPNLKKDFTTLQNVFLLPHLGSATFEARNKMAELAAKNVINVLKGNSAISQVN